MNVKWFFVSNHLWHFYAKKRSKYSSEAFNDKFIFCPITRRRNGCENTVKKRSATGHFFTKRLIVIEGYHDMEEDQC